MVPGLRGSSSPILKITFIKSEPISAILVKIPPAILSTEAPSDSPIAKPIKLAPAYSPGTKRSMMSIIISSREISTTPILIPAFRGMLSNLIGFLSKEAKAILELARVFILIPNQATLYDPSMPITVQPSIINTPPTPKRCSPVSGSTESHPK